MNQNKRPPVARRGAKTSPHRLIVNPHRPGEPEVRQAPLNGCELSWNPDNNRFYVKRDEKTIGIFQEWRNAVAFARKEI